MALTRYKQKRNFKESPEPVGGKPDSKSLKFVVQKHAASHLHYDFRLELDGVLKSWAVPKGPSTDPSVKRLAMMVEDHPYDYRLFEGIIPSGYGAGTVIVWDEGTYEGLDVKLTGKADLEKHLRKQLKAGDLKITLHGKKLKGSYALVHIKGKGDNTWLLIKKKDKYAASTDILKKDKSVLSKKTLEQIAKTGKNLDETKEDKKKPASVKKKTVKSSSAKSTTKLLKAGRRAAFPKTISPMLATLVDAPFDTPDRMYEIKWDGYRAISFCNKIKVTIKSRNNKNFDEKYYPVHDALSKLNFHAVLDGELVVLDEKGKSNFGDLQNWRSETDGDLYYYVFDVLWLDGKNLMGEPYTVRRKFLEELITGDGIIRLSETFNQDGVTFFNAAKKLGLEGIIAKKADSKYLPGIRNNDWLKIKANLRQEMVIGGYTINDGTSKEFSALLTGVFTNGHLHYTGKVGTGFNTRQQTEMIKLFKKHISKKSPFQEEPDINKPSRFRHNPPHAEVVWMKPELVCEVSFTEMTTDGVMRHPSFEGMRSDKKAKEVRMEKPKNTRKVVKPKEKSVISLKPSEKNEAKTLLNPSEETQVKKIKGHELKFSNLSKIYWPKEKITKRDMLNYYYQVAPYILPYLKDRPQSLNRYPDGINGESFYQKDISGKAPEWIKKYKYHTADDTKTKHFLVASDEASLLYMASLGCIEMNPWSSRITSPDNPDFCIIDLDPAENTFNQVIQAALVTKDILESLGAPCYAKTSGSTGIHVYIPLGAKYTYEQSKEFARVIAAMVLEELPGFTSTERIVNKRKGKMYIDFLQNRPQATVSCAYSLRPKPGATVSMPLHWEEVKKGLKMSDFTIFNALDRIKNEGDIFKPVLGKGINLEKIVKKFT